LEIELKDGFVKITRICAVRALVVVESISDGLDFKVGILEFKKSKYVYFFAPSDLDSMVINSDYVNAFVTATKPNPYISLMRTIWPAIILLPAPLWFCLLQYGGFEDLRYATA
jgi:hypothetical protein